MVIIIIAVSPPAVLNQWNGMVEPKKKKKNPVTRMHGVLLLELTILKKVHTWSVDLGIIMHSLRSRQLNYKG